jgi:hypothetical protein
MSLWIIKLQNRYILLQIGICTTRPYGNPTLCIQPADAFIKLRPQAAWPVFPPVKRERIPMPAELMPHNLNLPIKSWSLDKCNYYIQRIE